MRVYLNRQPKYGPWGGGSKTINKLAELLKERGHEVVYHLIQDVDLIFCMDPRPNEHGVWYQHFLDYRAKHGTKIIQRVGDVGTHSKPELTKLVKQTLPYSDYFIFPSNWAKDWIGFEGSNCEVIFNKPMKQFYLNRTEQATLSDKPRIVTHHWSTNPKKGFDIYQKLENYCLQTNRFEFTYIGRKPSNYKFNNYVEPIGVEMLAKEIPGHDIYVTASIEEAGANHVLEALAAALPVVFHERGGSIGDYCKEYGLSYNSFENMLEKLEEMCKNYPTFKDKVVKYSDDNSQVVNHYINIFEKFGNVT